MPSLRTVVFHPAALRELRDLPKPIRLKVGQALLAMQRGHGLEMSILRRLPSIVSGLAEVRVHDSSGQYRVLCMPGDSRGVVVLRAFAKKSRQMPRSEASLVRRRLKDLRDEENSTDSYPHLP
jgi:phage-related protein